MPATKPATKAPAAAAPKKAVKAATLNANVGDVVAFKGYETAPENPLIAEGDYVRITEIDATKKGRKRFHVQAITTEDGSEAPIDTAFSEELTLPTEQQSEEIAALLAQAEPETEDLGALGEAADGGDADAQARLTELATENELDPEAYPTWAELATALTPEDVEALGAEADAGNEEAQARLTELAAENDIDPQAVATWAEVAELIANAGAEPEEAPEVEEAPEPEAPAAKGAKGAKAAPVAKGAKGAKGNAKKGNTAPKAPKLALTPSMEKVLGECNNDLLAAMQQTEKQIGQSFLDLGGLVKLGELQNAHLTVLDDKGQPVFENTKKGYYQWVAANLETEERVARHLAKIYQVFIAKLKFEPEGLIDLGISRLREIAPIALKLAKEDKEANAAAKAANKPEDSQHLENFLQEAASLTVRDVVAKVRAYKAGPDTGEGGTGAGGVPQAKITMLTFRMFEDKAAFVKGVIAAAMTDLPDAEKNADNALFRVFASYAETNGLPAFVPAPAAKVAAKTTAPAAKGGKATAAKPAPAAKGAKAKATAK